MSIDGSSFELLFNRWFVCRTRGKSNLRFYACSLRDLNHLLFEASKLEPSMVRVVKTATLRDALDINVVNRHYKTYVREDRLGWTSWIAGVKAG